MTACDLSACTKPWKIQKKIVKVIYQEFYAEVSSVTLIQVFNVQLVLLEELAFHRD